MNGTPTGYRKTDEAGISAAQLAIQIELAGPELMSRVGSTREMEILMQAPLGPQRFIEDTVVYDEGGWYRMMTPSVPSAAYNEIFFSNLRVESSDDEVDALIAEYHERGLALTWCVYPWTRPADLGERLLARGATKYDITTFIGSSAPLERHFPGVEVEMIEPEATESYETYISLLAEGFNLTEEEAATKRERFFKLMSQPEPTIGLFLARFQGVVAGISSVVLKKDSAHMSGAYVRPALQARGVFPSLNAVSKAFVREKGIGMVTGHSNNKSAFWLERFGVNNVYAYTIYQIKPPGEEAQER